MFTTFLMDAAATGADRTVWEIIGPGLVECLKYSGITILVAIPFMFLAYKHAKHLGRR